MRKLKDLYAELKVLRDPKPTKNEKLSVEEKIVEDIDRHEEKIITNDILPALSQNIEPHLKEIQRELLLVVEYHPNEPISVALSRNTKISEIHGAKILTPHFSEAVPINIPKPNPEPNIPTRTVTNKTKGLRVTFANGDVICCKFAIETFIQTIKKIGFERVAKIGIMHSGIPLVGREKTNIIRRSGNSPQHYIDGWYVFSNTSNEEKKKDLMRISDAYDLKLKLEEVKPERK